MGDQERSAIEEAEELEEERRRVEAEFREREARIAEKAAKEETELEAKLAKLRELKMRGKPAGQAAASAPVPIRPPAWVPVRAPTPAPVPIRPPAPTPALAPERGPAASPPTLNGAQRRLVFPPVPSTATNAQIITMVLRANPGLMFADLLRAVLHYKKTTSQLSLIHI